MLKDREEEVPGPGGRQGWHDCVSLEHVVDVCTYDGVRAGLLAPPSIGGRLNPHKHVYGLLLALLSYNVTHGVSAAPCTLLVNARQGSQSDTQEHLTEKAGCRGVYAELAHPP